MRGRSRSQLYITPHTYTERRQIATIDYGKFITKYVVQYDIYNDCVIIRFINQMRGHFYTILLNFRDCSIFIFSNGKV